MSILHIIVLAVIQGLAELLPVSSSAHVIVAEKLMGMDPSSPKMTLLLVMLHTGTMFAVILYFWKKWRRAFLQDLRTSKHFAFVSILATAATGLVGGLLIKTIEQLGLGNTRNAEVEQLFSHLEFIAPALALTGVVILFAGMFEKRTLAPSNTEHSRIQTGQAGLIGAVQGLCLAFRGLSRSGSTISVAMLVGIEKAYAEDFSFALAVILTPLVIAREALRLVKAEHINSGGSLASLLVPCILGAFCAFLAGLLALRWLSRWLESGRWYLFGIYCLVAAAVVAFLHHLGF
jgi:undecaprenyl-diphosphatase